jgi:hypothetical protein
LQSNNTTTISKWFQQKIILTSAAFASIVACVKMSPKTTFRFQNLRLVPNRQFVGGKQGSRQRQIKQRQLNCPIEADTTIRYKVRIIFLFKLSSPS